MTNPWFLSRVSLRDDASVQAIAPVLLPAQDDERVSASHRLIWSLFAGDPTRARDFLWHEEEPGLFLVFSPEAPPEETALFRVETRPFAHWPQAGEHLRFLLRANPTRSLARHDLKPNGKRRRGQRVDVVMEALHALPGRSVTREGLESGKGRAFLRDDVLGWLPEGRSVDSRRPVEDWMTRQGEAAGFHVAQMQVDAYRSLRLPREGARGQSTLSFGQVDISGTLVIADAGAFAKRLRDGFGRAKAFGCGLMLLARQDDRP